VLLFSLTRLSGVAPPGLQLGDEGLNLDHLIQSQMFYQQNWEDFPPIPVARQCSIAAMRKSNLTLIKGRAQSQTLADALASFLLDKQAGNRTPKTIAYYRFELERFVIFCQAAGALTLAEVTADLVRQYVVALQARKLKSRSQHAALRATKAFFNWCVAQGFLAVSPQQNVAMPKQSQDLPRVLSVEEVKALLEAATTSRDKAVVLGLLNTGCRAAEFCALNIGDVNLRTGAVLVRHGKGQKAREVYLDRGAQRALQRYLFSRPAYGVGDPLWVSSRAATEDGTRLTVSGLQQILKRLGERAGVTVSPHDFRRTFATWCHREGMSLETIRILMGHSDYSILKKYLALQPEDLRSAHQAAALSAKLG
jgi:site-specific recombinase XerD